MTSELCPMPPRKPPQHCNVGEVDGKAEGGDQNPQLTHPDRGFRIPSLKASAIGILNMGGPASRSV